MKLTSRLQQIVLVIIVFVVFSPTFFNDFQTSWDDQWMLTENPFVINSSLENIRFHFFHFYNGQYSPIVTLVYTIIYKLFGLNPVAFHATCLLIHMVNVLLVFHFIIRVLGKVKSGWRKDRINWYSTIVALIFAVHPLQVESVAWISAIKTLLYSFCFLAGMLCYLRFIESRNWHWFFLVIILYILSFGSKEQAIIFPLNIIAIDWFVGRYKGSFFSPSFMKNIVLIEKVPFFLLAGLMWAFSLQNNLGSLNYGEFYLFQRTMFAMSSFMDYIFRFLAPVKLFYLYFFPITPEENLPFFYWAYPLLVSICLIFIFENYRRNNSLVVFGFLLFLINILLVLHIVPVPRTFITADRFMYFSIIGLAIIVVWTGDYLLRKRKKIRWVALPLFSLWLLFMSISSFSRTMDWKNSDSIKNNINELIEQRKKENLPVIENVPGEVEKKELQRQ